MCVCRTLRTENVSMPTIRSRILKRRVCVHRQPVATAGLNANDPFEDTETVSPSSAGCSRWRVSMPTIRSRILKPEQQRTRDCRCCGLNANDPFEDTETLAVRCIGWYQCPVSMPTIRSRILKRYPLLISLSHLLCLNANDPFEDTETDNHHPGLLGDSASQCQQSVRGY